MARPEPPRFRPRQFPPPQFPVARPALFSRTPPAVFPAILGLLGLGLALRRTSAALDLPPAGAEAVLGAVSLLWLFAALAYVAKMARRPGVVLDDLRILPGRAGVAALLLGLMLVAAVLVPYAPGLAQAALFAGLGLHGLLALTMIRLHLATAPEAREVTPVWHLNFVGFIVGGIAAVPLGLASLAQALLWGTIPLAALIWAASLVQLSRRIPPPPLRPLLAIHLAPASLFATVAALLGQTGLALGFAALGGVILLALLGATRWLTVAGFTPLWGAFAFPLAAYVSSLMLLDLATIGSLVLMLALALIPYIAVKVLKLWATGGLAAKTNAAQA